MDKNKIIDLGNGFSLRPILPTEVGTLLAMSRETFFTAFYHLNRPEDMEAFAAAQFTEAKLLHELQTPGSCFYFALDAQGIRAGFVKLNTGTAQQEFKTNNSLEIERLYVLQMYQGRGLGKLMLNFALKQARQAGVDFIWLGVWEHNLAAQRLYARMGFTHCGSHSFMLGTDRQTDLLMKYEL